ncbi:RNA polymerase sigma factor [Aquimarina sp. TRL1]|uniref:RNA polymerase sigma factor n=1 Tax=Aquimarina sp. (strain TRL1) TaxID=2736252 RepID=UPI0034CDEF93
MMSENVKDICKPKVFEDIYRSQSRTLRNYIYYKSGDVEQAEDIVQEAFVKLWKNCSKVIFEKAAGFLFLVAKNMHLNHETRKKVIFRHRQTLGNTEKRSIESPEFLLEEKEFMIKIERVLANLPDGQREVFLLNRIDKKTYKEIAEIVGISVKAVEKRMYNALLVIRKEIGDV